MNDEATPRPTRMAATLAALIAAIGVGYSVFALDTLILAGTFPHASAWFDAAPLTALASLGLIVVAALVRRPGWTSAAGGALAWSLGVSALCELPSFATNFDLGDDPGLWPWLLGIATLLGLFTVAAPATCRPATRLATLAVFASTSNGKLFSRDDQAVYALLAAAVLLLWIELSSTRLRPLGRSGRIVAGVVASFVLWVFLAALAGDAVGQGLRVAGRVAIGALLALALALTLDERGRRTTAMALLAGVGASLLILIVGYVQTAQVTGWSPLLDSRLRLFDMHPNGIGPLFALGLTLGLGFAAGKDTGPVGRLLGASIAVASTAALLQTDSRASLLGGAVGAAVLVVAWRVGAPRRAGWIYALGVAGVVAGAALLSTPLTDGLRAKLDGMAETQSALGQRYHFWRMAVAALEQSPWTGVGPNQYHVHAQFAEPSYYDGTTQTLHTHNLALGVAEGAGWPALALYGLLLIATLEAARRTLRMLREPGQRAVPAGLLAALAALHAANLLDLGQSQGTFVPTFGWIALGWFGSHALREHRGGSASPLATLPLAAIGALLAVAQPLAGTALRERSATLSDRGRPVESLAAQRRALAVDPGDTRGVPNTARMAARMGWRDVALELRELRRDSAPGRANAHLSLAREQLALGRLSAALRSLQTARELDPLGDLRAEFEVVAASLAIARGDYEVALEALVRCCLMQGTPWDRMPMIDVPATDSEDRYRAFSAPDGSPALALADVLDRVKGIALSKVESDPVTARRELLAVVIGYRAEGHPLRGTEALREYGQRHSQESIASLVVIEADSLMAAGRYEEALTIVNEHSLADRKAMLFRRARALYGLDRIDEALELADRAHAAREVNDLFFDAGTYAPLAQLRLQLCRRTGRWEDAAAALRVALRDTRDDGDRLELASDHWREVLDAEAGRGPILEALSILGPALGAKLEAPDRSGAMDARARRAVRAAGGDRRSFVAAAVRRLDGGGLAAEELRAAFERLAQP